MSDLLIRGASILGADSSDVLVHDGVVVDMGSLAPSDGIEVVDADGMIWNARWGVGEIHHYATDGTIIARYKLPAKQTTCPAFIGRDADRLMVTTARENLDAEAVKADPEAGYTYELGVPVRGRFDAAYKI